MLPESDRKDLAIQALARSTTISDLSVRHSVSRKFVYQQAHKAGAALDEVFLSGTPEDDVLFHLVVSKTWLRPHPSPHFVPDRTPPNSPLLTSISANRCISGSSRCSGMFGISS